MFNLPKVFSAVLIMPVSQLLKREREREKGEKMPTLNLRWIGNVDFASNCNLDTGSFIDLLSSFFSSSAVEISAYDLTAFSAHKPSNLALSDQLHTNQVI